MTTAHRPTFDPARGKEAQRGPAYHQRLLPAHTVLKHRQSGQGGDADGYKRDLRAELLEAEARHFAKKNGTYVEPEAAMEPGNAPKRQIDAMKAEDDDIKQEDEDETEAAQKRRRIEVIERYREEDADDSSNASESSDDDDDEDETVALQRELERIRKERAAAQAKEDAKREAEEAEQREIEVSQGNPLLNAKDYTMKRRWDDDVIFKNQARGSEDRNKKKEFINDMLRSDFHKKFMSKYVR